MEFGLWYLNSHFSHGMKLQYVKIQKIACNIEFARNLLFSGKREMRGRSFRNVWPIFSCWRGGFTSGIYPQPGSTLVPTSGHFMCVSLEVRNSQKNL